MIGDETRVNTDDLHYFDKQSALEPAPPQLRLPRFQVSALPYFMRAEDTLRDAIRTEQMVAQLLARYGFYRTQQDLFRAYCLMPGNGNVRYFLSRGFPDGKLPDHETFCTVRSLNQQALRLRGQGRYVEAEPLYRQVLEMLERAFGPEHDGVAETLSNLAMVCQAQGKYADAEPLFRRSLELRQKAFGPDHPYVAALLENMARCYKEMGDTKEAEKLAARAKRIRSEQ